MRCGLQWAVPGSNQVKGGERERRGVADSEGSHDLHCWHGWECACAICAIFDRQVVDMWRVLDNGEHDRVYLDLQQTGAELTGPSDEAEYFRPIVQLTS